MTHPMARPRAPGRLEPTAAKPQWVVRLGRAEWQRFTYERGEGDELTLLGSVRRGARIGALAQQADGSYVQVNGDYLSPLNSRHIRAALGRAEPADRRDSGPAELRDAGPPSEPRANPKPPVVIVKRRRILGEVPPGGRR